MVIMYEKELTGFSKSGARYLIIGAIALGLHDYPRATFDLDILPDLNSENLDKIIKVLVKRGYKPRVPVDPNELKDPKKRKEWYKEKNMKVFSFWRDRDHSEIDLMIYHPLNFEECFERKSIVNIRGVEVYVASLEDLIKMKKISNREKDLNDIRILERLLELKKLEKNE